MKKDFLIERQGKTFALYAGLLDLAHEKGLISIETKLIQAPSEQNGHIAVCSATITLQNEGGPLQTFTGIGDAAPNNVAPAMKTCLIRMSETRAKARALRDATNIGVAAFEELGEEDSYDGAPERGYATRPQGQAAPRQASAPPRQTRQATPPQGRPAPAPVGNQCPECHAPEGRHATRCSKAQAATPA